MILGSFFSHVLVLIVNGRGGLCASEMELRFLGDLFGSRLEAAQREVARECLGVRHAERKGFVYIHDSGASFTEDVRRHPRDIIVMSCQSSTSLRD